MRHFEKIESSNEIHIIEPKPQVKKEEKQPLAKLTDLDWSNFTIVIAEDEEHSFIYMRSILEITKINIIRAKNGRECVDIVRKNSSVRLILMDIQMPVMNGMEATKAIKSFRKDIVIITQTAFALKENKDNCLAVGSDDFLTKPIRIDTLLTTLKKFIVKL